MLSDPTRQPAAQPLVRLQGVDRTFTSGEVKVPVLKDLSLEILRGEVLAVVGPSGSGKSTILNLVGGLDRPTAGEVWFEDQNLATASSARLTRYRREKVGFVFQFYNLVPNLTALENVLTATEIAEDPLDASEVLEQVGLKDRMTHFPSQLSGGEQQRVAIARAVAKNPQLLLCDEPTGALDYQTGINALKLLLKFNRDLGTTVVLITHNEAISHVANRVVHLRSGEISNLQTIDQPIAPEEVVW